jgi:maltose-binding protein MalE
MKNRRKFVYVAVVAILAAGAYFLFSGNGDSSEMKKNLDPEGVVEEFTAAMKEGNFEKAGKLCAADSMSVYLDSFKQMWNALSNKGGEAFDETVAILAGTEVHFAGMQEMDGVCLVDYTLEMNGIQKKHQATLRMEEGEWKVVKITDKN